MNNDISTYHRGLLFPTDGLVAPVRIHQDKVLQDLYREIRCSMVEVVVLVPGVNLWRDEEALLKRSPRPNRVWLVRRCSGNYTHPIFGNAVVLGETPDGAARSLTVEEADEALTRVIGTNPTLAPLGDTRPGLPALAHWLEEGIDWRQ